MSTLPASHVFISYSRANVAYAKRLASDLQKEGITVWVDQSGLKPGTQDWENALRAAISRAHAVILLASEEARKSTYVKDELRLANEVYHLPIYPLWVEGTQWINCIPLGWGGTQFIDARGGEAQYQAAFRQLAAALKGDQSMTSLLPVPLPYSTTHPPYPGQTSIYTPSLAGAGIAKPARKSSGAACLIPTLAILVVVGVLLFLLAGSVISSIAKIFNNPGNLLPQQTSSGRIHVTPTSFNITRTEGTANGCFYFNGSGWTCNVALQNVSSTGDLSWTTSISPDSITLSPSAFTLPAGQSMEVSIKIPDSFSGQGDITFKGPENSEHVTIVLT